MFRPLAVVAVISLGSAACTQAPGSANYCAQSPAACALIAGLVVAGGVALARSNRGGSYGTYPGYGGYYTASDSRLKTDILPVGTTENGVPIHAFRYLGGPEVFVGPLADELRTDPRFAHAVTTGEDGFLRVDLAALELRVINAPAMFAAGERALRLGTP